MNAKNDEGETPALLAAARGHADVLSLLVDGYGATLDTADAKGAGPLHKACERRDSSAASVLLESYGLQADQADPQGTTPLHLAARGGDASLVELLTGPAGRANPSLRDAEGNQPLHIAAACGHLGVVRVLVEKASADPGEGGWLGWSRALALQRTEFEGYLLLLQTRCIIMSQVLLKFIFSSINSSRDYPARRGSVWGPAEGDAYIQPRGARQTRLANFPAFPLK